MKDRMAYIFIIIGLIFAIFSLPFSGALSQERMDRQTSADVVSDSSAVLTLQGFNNTTATISNINKRYFSVGSITNNSSKSINLTVTITPDFSQLKSKNYWLGIEIGSTISTFDLNTANSQNMNLFLDSGQTLNVMAALTNNQPNIVPTSFNFEAKETSGTYTMKVVDTAKTPRRIIFK